MSSALVSVVLPVYNGQKYIERAIESILNQSYQNLELVIVDDGSTDHTIQRISGFNDARIQCYKRSHMGVAETANFGMKQCKGTYIARMDADDIAMTERIRKQVDFLDENPEIGVVSCLVHHQGDRNTQGGYANHVDWLNSLLTPDEIYNHRFADSPVANPSVMFRRELLEHHGDHKTSGLPEDYELWLRWMHHGVKIGKVPEILLHWSDYSTRLTRTNPDYDDDRFQEVKAHYFNLWYKKNGHNRPIWVWGNSRWVRKRVSFLQELGVSIAGYIDIVHTSDEKVIHYETVGLIENPIILSYVADRKGKLEIQQWLDQQGYRCGKDYWMMV